MKTESNSFLHQTYPFRYENKFKRTPSRILNPPKRQRQLSAIVSPLLKLTEQSEHLFYKSIPAFFIGEQAYLLPSFVFLGPQGGGDPIRIGFFAAIHGDEPEGARALVSFIQELNQHPEWAANYHLFFYPICNPSGHEDATRHARSGKDLNREFWVNSDQPEVYYLEQELEKRQFHGIVSLHSDHGADGVYAYARGAVLTEALTEPALRAAEQILPRSKDVLIDGFQANRAILRECFHGVLSNPPHLTPEPFEIIFETPSTATLNLQIQASVAALKTILREYRSFIAFSQNL